MSWMFYSFTGTHNYQALSPQSGAGFMNAHSLNFAINGNSGIISRFSVSILPTPFSQLQSTQFHCFPPFSRPFNIFGTPPLVQASSDICRACDTSSIDSVTLSTDAIPMPCVCQFNIHQLHLICLGLLHHPTVLIMKEFQSFCHFTKCYLMLPNYVQPTNTLKLPLHFIH